jgi:hypothetical protein
MNVIKADGSKERFRREKIIGTCLRAGADRFAAERIANRIEKAVSDNTTTHDIYQLIVKELEQLEDKSSILFKLREAVALLDSKSFELYVKKVLEAAGFACEWNRKINGACVTHQIDVIARERSGKIQGEQRTYLVECKRHTNPHRFTGLGTVLQVQARLEDVVDGRAAGKNSSRIDAAWIVTNTKFSDHAKLYARGKGIRLTGWHYEAGWELEKLAQDRKIFPVTILGSGAEVKEILSRKIVTVGDFLKSKYSRRKNTVEIAGRARKLLS